MSHELLTAFFGWMTVLNFAVLIFMTVMIVVLQDWAASVHSRMFQIETATVKRAYFRYLANYKILTIIFCLIPWIALKLV